MSNSQYKSRSLQYVFILLLAGSLHFSANASNAVVLDISKYKVEHGKLTKPAVLAFIKRNWDVEKIMPTMVIGSLENGKYKVEIEYADLPVVLFRYSKEGRSGKQSWLMALEREFAASLLSCE